MPRLTIAPDRGDAGVRLDRVLLRHLSRLSGVSRNRLQRLVATGAVTINGVPATRSSTRLRLGDAIDVLLPEPRTRAPVVASPAALDICYEDARLLIVNKPPGQVSHPTQKHASGTLLQSLSWYAAERWTPSLVSRLDKGTSGLVLVAKSPAHHTALQRLAAANRIDKQYLAIVAGKPPSRGTIDLALDRDPWDARRVTVRDRGGQPSVTRFERIGVVTNLPNTTLSLVRCRLITGRMHQIRVHLAARGWPIVGDVTYGVRWPGIERPALHACRLSFVDPVTGSGVEVTAPPPADMTELLRLFQAGELA